MHKVCITIRIVLTLCFVSVGLAACGSSIHPNHSVALRSQHSLHGSANATPSRSKKLKSPPADTTSTTVAAPDLVTVSIPVVPCQSSSGANVQPITLPSSQDVTLPSTLSNGLAVYADSFGFMKVVAPVGWSCVAFFGADGTGGIVAYPSTETPPSSRNLDWSMTPNSPIQGVVINRASPCYTCMLAQACLLFPSAATTFQQYLGHSCSSPPSSETDELLSAGLALFQDPPGVAGTGNPSGGLYAANGVMTYYPQLDESYMETCTVPSSEKADCTSILNTFIDWYGKG